jgi:DMSO/TMAO reductase YedYZ molybdopterin-dependent catalytic subunit
MPEKDAIISSDTRRKERVPPGQYQDPGMPVLHKGSIPRFDQKTWRFSIRGEVAKEKQFTYDEFASLPYSKVYSDIHCVTTWSKLDNTWEGVSSRTLKERIEIEPEANFVLVHSADGYTTNLPLDEFFQDDVLFVLFHDNKPITPEHGAPVRLVVPKLYFWKSAKWAIGLEFLKKDKKGFWEQRGYHNHGDPWKEERYG